MSKISIAIIDDHELFREGVKLILSQNPEFQVVYETDNGNLFLEYLNDHMPDVVLMDIEMPEANGIEVTQKAINKCSNLKIIALTMFQDAFNYTSMINAGAKGFLLKKASKLEIYKAITDVNNGGNYFSQEILQNLAFMLVNKSSDTPTNRERDILQLICEGLTSQEISDKLFISIKTVEVHRTNIFSKAHVRNIAQLIVWAVKNNYFTIS